MNIPSRHQKRPPFRKANHLSKHRLLARHLHLALHDPTGTRMPEASKTKPVNRVKVPRDSNPGAVGHEPVHWPKTGPKKCQAQSPSSSPSCHDDTSPKRQRHGASVFHAAIDHCPCGLHQAITRRHRRGRLPLHAPLGVGATQMVFDSRQVVRVQTQ